jgi:N-acetylglutamate synthase-like GNAT family acetyltransferase
VPASYAHNQLLIDSPVSPVQLAADADRVLAGAGLGHRQAHLGGAHLADTAAALAADGWDVTELVGMAAPTGGEPVARAQQVDLDALRPMLAAGWRRDVPDLDETAIAQLADRFAIEDTVADIRYLAVRGNGEVVACALLKIDGGTALLDAVMTDPASRGRGHGDALVRTALAVAAEAGCDLVVLDAAAADWPRHWYERRGFTAVTRSWSARR